MSKHFKLTYFSPRVTQIASMISRPRSRAQWCELFREIDEKFPGLPFHEFYRAVLLLEMMIEHEGEIIEWPASRTN